MSNVFLTATESRNKARNDLLIFDEVRTIERAVLNILDTDAYELYVSDTIMTDTTPTSDSISYFNVWQKTETDRVKTEQMNKVITYFEDMGYSIVRVLNSTTNTTFKWYITF